MLLQIEELFIRWSANLLTFTIHSLRSIKTPTPRQPKLPQWYRQESQPQQRGHSWNQLWRMEVRSRITLELLLERLPSSPIMIDWTCLTTCLCPAMISIGLIKTGQAKEGSKTVSQERTFRSVQISNVFSGKGGTVLPLLCIICRTKQRTKVWISCYQAIYKLRSDVRITRSN